MSAASKKTRGSDPLEGTRLGSAACQRGVRTPSSAGVGRFTEK